MPEPRLNLRSRWASLLNRGSQSPKSGFLGEGAFLVTVLGVRSLGLGKAACLPGLMNLILNPSQCRLRLKGKAVFRGAA